MRTILIGLILATMTGCAGMLVRQQDLDAWVGVPVEALDTHSLFATMPMSRTISPSGIEVRNYANGRQVANCTGFGNANRFGRTVNATTFNTCTQNWRGCNNIFYIKDGAVIEYAPTGNCITDGSVQPEERYLRMMRR